MKKFFLITLVISLMLCIRCHADVTTELDISYGEANGQKLLLDVIRPAEKSATPRPALILVHGGAWSAGDKSEMREMAENLAGQGYVTFPVNYRLVTKTDNKWPAQLDDTQRAVRWIRADATKYGADPKRIGAIGGSAGGHIVACLATSDTRDNSDRALSSYSSRVSCVIDMAGPTDLTDDIAPKTKNGAWTNEQIRLLLGGPPEKFKELARNASPIFKVDSKTCPLLIVHGKKDDIVPVDQAERFAATLKKAGVEVKLLVLEKEGHGVESTDSVFKFILAANSFLKKHLK